MSSDPWDVVIIGGGLAGVEAALTLRDHKLQVLLLDENPELGGQYLKAGNRHQVPKERLRREGLARVRELKQSGVRVLTGCEVLGLSQERQVVFRHAQKGMLEVTPKAVVLACGARERFLPFPGWTLPGVVSTGAVQLLIKMSRRLPAKRVLVAGAGAFPWALADQILAMKGTLQALVDQSSWSERISLALAMARLPYKWSAAFSALAGVVRSRAPIHAPAKIREARGNGRLEEVDIIHLDQRGREIPGSQQTLPCELLALGQGFTPNTELAVAAGCDLLHDPDLGGWVVRVTPGLESSLGGVFAVGELTGIAGAGKSRLEGRLAGLGVLLRLGRIIEETYQRRARPLRATRRRELAFGRVFNRISRIPDQAFGDIPDETIICRCEDVSAGEVRQAAGFGAITMDAVKRATRTGMGICQGRTCGFLVQELLRLSPGSPPAEPDPISTRIPVKAVRLSELAKPLVNLKQP